MWQNWRKSAEEKQAERITAYVDGLLTAVEKQKFEQALANDPALQEAVAAEQALKMTLAQLPRLRAPRNFTLNTAVYARQSRPTLAMIWYPRLRTATAVVGLLLAGIIALSYLTPPAAEQTVALAPAAQLSEPAPAPLATQAVALEAESAPAALPEQPAFEVATEETAETVAEDAADLSIFAAEPAPEMADSMVGITNTAQEEESGAVTETLRTVEVAEEVALLPVPLATPTAVSSPAPPPTAKTSPSFDLWAILQRSLLFLFGFLLAATLILRRRL
jgi:anti-sigma factor RsiW